ncbi:hypothetical protein ABZW30_15135 [Kitasatospora sp. NPDC004669]|uniref:hypothetical protein n=1 Tax=Kitasatospora sp. NPDC004669 TaxID=3154555 RepID=UPI0033BBB092
MDDPQAHLLRHARHLVVEEDGTTVHTDPDGSLHLDEQEWRLRGVFRDETTATAQLAIAREPPGFCDEPGCFATAPMLPDKDQWTDGFVTVVH